MNSTFFSRKFVSALFLALLVLGGTASAATITVLNAADTGAGSLRNAITTAASGDTIVFDPLFFNVTRTITIGTASNPLLIKDKNLTIIGPGSNLLTISGGGVSRGLESWNTGDAENVYDVVISGMKFTSCNGASARFSGEGGAIENENKMVLTDVVFLSNTASFNGGAVDPYGANLTCRNCVFDSNTANLGGALLLANDTVTNPGAKVTYIFDQCTFKNNAAGYGGCMYLNGSNLTPTTGAFVTLTCTNTTFSGNICNSAYGPVLFTTGSYNSSQSLTFRNCTANGNTYAAGVNASDKGTFYLQGSSTFQNCTISGNDRGALFFVGDSAAGAPAPVYTVSGSIIFSNNGNDLERATGQAFPGTLSVTNSLYTSNATTIAAINGTNTGNVTASNPSLGVLANNGGFVQTMALSAGSPAINAGSNAGGATTDARGYARSVGTTDMGAYEFGATTFDFAGVLFPPNNALEVSAGTNLVMNFGSAASIVAGTGNIDIKKFSDNSVFESIPAGDARVTISGGVVTINPTGVLGLLTKYYVNFPAGTFKDSGNNTVNAFSTNSVWAFTTNNVPFNSTPTITGAVAGQAVTDKATVQPFTGVTISDVDAGDTQTVTVTLDVNAKGSFTTLNGFSGTGPYTFTGSAATATTAIRGMVFTPAANRVTPASTETTTLTIATNDGNGGTASNATTTVVSTSVNDAPTIGGAVANQAVNDNATVSPFSALTITDPDVQGETAIVTITNGANRGDFTAGSTVGWTRTTPGSDIVYTRVFVSAANAGAGVQTAVRALVFQPRQNAIAVGSTESTGFTVSVNDGVAAAATDSSTSVITTSVNNAPTLSGGPFTFTAIFPSYTSAGATVNTILAGVTYADVDFAAQKGIAVTASSALGNWQYSTDGTTWTNFGAVATATSLLLDGGTQVRYVAGASGETATFTFRAWDETTGTASSNGSPQTANTTVNGAATAFSSGTATGSIVVNPDPKLTATLGAVPIAPASTSPGGTINYSAKISNTDTITKTGVAFNLTLDANTTLVAGTQNASPYTIDQAAVAATLGVPKAITLQAVDPDAAQTLTYAITQNPANGTLSGFNSATGAVTYTATALGADTFKFKATDNFTTPASSNEDGVVTLNVTSAPLNNFLVEAVGGGAIGAQTAGVPFNVKITARDASNNTKVDFTSNVTLTSTSTLTAGGTTANFVNGVLASTSVTLTTSGASHTLTATNGAVNTASAAFVINPGPLNNFLVEASGGGAIGTQTAGTPFTLRITARDVFNNTQTSFVGTAAITSTSALTVGGTTAAFTAGVLASHSVTLTTTGINQTVTATSGSTGTSNTFTINPGALNNFIVEGSGGVPIPTQLAGTPFNLRLTARDAFNNVKTDFTGAGNTAVLTSTGTLTGAPLTSGTFTAGVKDPQAVTITNGGTFTITAKNGVPTGVSNSFNVNAPPSAVADAPIATSTPTDLFHVAFNASNATANGANVLTNDALGFPVATLTKFGPSTGAETNAGTAGTTLNGGTLTVAAAGTFTYTPPLNFTGLDSFKYTLTNAVGSSVGTVQIGVGFRPATATDTYATTLIGNVGIDTSVSTQFSVLTNDTGSNLTAAFVSATSGTGTVSSNGKFTFNPSAGFSGTGSITYSITNGFGTVNGTVNIPVSTSKVWFVDNNAGTNGTGTLASPFNSLPNFVSAAVDAAGDSIFLYRQTATTYLGPITLKGTQKLVGQGAAATLASITGLTFPADSAPPATGGTKPVIATNGVTLGLNNVVNGLAISVDTTSGLILGADIGTTGSVTNVDIANSSVAAGIQTIAAFVGTLNYTTGTLSNTGSSTSITMAGASSGSMTFTNVAVGSTGSGRVFSCSGHTGGTISFTGTSSLSCTGTQAVNAVSIQNCTGTTFNLGAITLTPTGAGCTGILALTNTAATTINVASGTISVSGPALDITGPIAVGLSLGTLTSTGGANGINIGGATTGSITATGGSLSGATGAEFNVTGGSCSITYPGNITGSAGQRSVNISGKTAGTVALSGAISDTGTGISLSSNTGATINFSGTITASTGANTAFNATGGGTVSATNAASTLTTTTGTALNVANTTIGAGNLNFKSISAGTAASGPASGIILNATGASGGLVVTGTGSAGSGGTIQKTTGSGISLTSVLGSASFTDMNISNTTGDGITATTVRNFSCTLCNLTNPGGAANKSGMKLADLSGAASLTTVTVTGSATDGVNLTNTSATLTSLTITGGSFSSTNNAFATAGSGLIVIAKTTGVITAATVSGVTFNANFSSGLQSFAQDTAMIGDITVSGCTFTNNGAAAADFDAGTGSNPQMKFHFLNNLTITGNVGPVINVFSSSTATGGLIQGRIDGNHVGTVGTPGSGSTGGEGIRVFLQGVAGNITIVNNIIRETACSRGISVQTLGPQSAGGANRVSDIVITGNDVNNQSTLCTFPEDDIYLASDNQAGTSTTLRAEVHGNKIKAAGASPANTDYPFDGNTWLYFNIATLPSTAQLVDFGGPHATANAAIAATQTSGTAGALAGVTLIPGPINTVPLLFALGGVERATYTQLPPINDDPVVDTLSSKVPCPCAARNKARAARNAGIIQQSELDVQVAAARARWEATGLSDAQRATLGTVKFEVATLSGGRLGEAGAGVIRVDATAGGNGWFIDDSPTRDVQFVERKSATRFYTTPQGAAAGRIDLLTALMHEMGHAIGLADSYDPKDRDSIMYGWLTKGERRVPVTADLETRRQRDKETGIQPLLLSSEAVDRGAESSSRREDGIALVLVFGLFAFLLWYSRRSNFMVGLTAVVVGLLLIGSAHAATVSEPSIGNLPPGKSTTITFNALVANPTVPANATSITQQGQVTATNVTGTVVTDDPSTVAVNDPTVTIVTHIDITAPTVSPTTAVEGSSTAFSFGGTFTDPGGAAELPFTAVVNWGDTTTSAVTVSGAGNPFTYSFSGNHTYAQSGSFNVTITVTNKDSQNGTSPATVVTVSNVAPTVATPAVAPTTANEGTATSFTVNGTFTDPAGVLDQPFTAVVNWGDTTTSTATVSGSGPFNYSFTGNHTYPQNGLYNVTISVTDKDSGVGTSSATVVTVNNVAPTVAAPTVAPTTVNEGASTAFTVSGTFTDPAGALDQTFTAVVNWGDGGPTSPAVVSAFGYSFSGNHTYAQSGSYNVTVAVTDKDGGIGTSAATVVTVNNVAPTVSTPAVSPTSTSEGTSTAFTVSGTFTDPANALDQAYTAVVNWGDTTTSTVVVSGGANPFNYSFSGNHTYAQSGSYNVTISVTDKDGGTGTSAATVVTVSNTAPTVGTPTVVPSGVPLNVSTAFSVTGTFTDPAGALDQPFTAVVNWGDGSPTSAAVVSGAANPFNYTFNGNHTYTTPGQFNVTVSVTDKDGSTGTSAAFVVGVGNPVVGTPVVSPTSTSEGSSTAFSVNGTFNDPLNSAEIPFSAVVDWGDGSATDVAIVSGVANPFGYAFNGNHTYAQSGSFNVTVSVTNKDGRTGVSAATVVSVANVAPTVSTPVVSPTSTNEGASTPFTVNGTFTDPAGALDQAYTAVVKWGDTTTSTAVVSGSGNPFSYSFSGNHTYAQNGTYNVTVSVTDKDGGTGTSAVTTVTVANVAPTVSTPVVAPTSTNEGASTPFTVSGTFTDPANALDQAYTAVVNWGDGTPSNTAVVSGASNPFNYSFIGNHTYAQSGSYNVTISVTDKDGGIGASSATVVTVANVAPTVSTPVVTPTTTNDGTNASFTVSGTFTDPANTLDQPYTAVVNWGDSTTSTAVVSGAGNPFGYSFSGAHAYATSANYNVTVSVTDKDGSTGTSAATVVSVTNIAPTITGTVANQPVNDNATILPFSGVTIGDVDTPAQTLTVTITLSSTLKGSITTLNGFTGGPSVFTFTGIASAATSAIRGVVFTPTPNRLPVGQSDIEQFTVTASDGIAPTVSNATSSVVITSINDAPSTVQILLTLTSINENDAVTLNGTFVDPDAQDTHSVSIDWGDGSAASVVPLAANVFAFSIGHTYLNNPAGAPLGSFTVTATVADASLATANATTSIQVKNVAPTVTINGAPASITLGGSAALTSTVVDPGTLDTFTYAWSVTKNGAPFATGNQAGFTLTPDTDGAYVVSLTVTDSDGATGSAAVTIGVDAGITALNSVTAVVNPLNGLEYVFTAYVNSTWPVTYAWDFGDGSPIQTGNGVTHDFPAVGTYTVTLSVTFAETNGPVTVTQQLAVTINGGAINEPIVFEINHGKVNFNLSTQKDTLQLQGYIPLPLNFQPTGKVFTVSVGSLTRTFTLNSKAIGGDVNNRFSLTYGNKKQKFFSTSTKFKLLLKNQNIYDSVKQLGFQNAVISTKQLITLPVTMTYEGQTTLAAPVVLYRAKSTGGSGPIVVPK